MSEKSAASISRRKGTNEHQIFSYWASWLAACCVHEMTYISAVSQSCLDFILWFLQGFGCCWNVVNTPLKKKKKGVWGPRVVFRSIILPWGHMLLEWMLLICWQLVSIHFKHVLNTHLEWQLHLKGTELWQKVIVWYFPGV